jgi:hypothetical protein
LGERIQCLETNADSASAHACGGMFDVHGVGLGQAMSWEQRGGSGIFLFFFIQVEQFITLLVYIYMYLASKYCIRYKTARSYAHTIHICVLLQNIAYDMELFGPMRVPFQAVPAPSRVTTPQENRYNA